VLNEHPLPWSLRLHPLIIQIDAKLIKGVTSSFNIDTVL
jgi:hypothetical protein